MSSSGGKGARRIQGNIPEPTAASTALLSPENDLLSSFPPIFPSKNIEIAITALEAGDTPVNKTQKSLLLWVL